MISKSTVSGNATRGRAHFSTVLTTLAALAVTLVAGAQTASTEKDGDIDLANCDPSTVFRTYASKPGETLSTSYGVVGSEGNVFLDVSPGSNCSGTNPTLSCLEGLVSVQAPAPQGTGVPASSKVNMTSSRAFVEGDLGKEARWSSNGSLAPNGDSLCTQQYRFWVTSGGGGWGEPHITTVDGVHYDFQSAGEFTALRQDGFEVQTRQTAVPTASVPGPNEYTGLASCVSIYTAVAARIGENRVTLQPRFDGEPNPNNGLQLRVNGELVTLTEKGIDLPGDQPGVLAGRIVPVAGGAIEIKDARGTQLVVAPAFWDSQQKWYLNVNVYQTSATQGIFGRTTNGWLPALPDGTSLGARSESAQERYQQLNETFADAWRVTEATSLFDYAPGTNTATFTLDEWPRFNPESCAIEGKTSAQPTTPQAAEQACSGVTDPALKADCIFDVTVTGETGFAQSYEAMQRFQPHGAGWQPPLVAGNPPPPPLPPSGWHGWWWIVLSILLVIIIIVLIMRKKQTV